MIGDAAFIAYCLVALFTARRVFSAFRGSEIRQFGVAGFDGEATVMGGLLGLIAGAFWPVAIFISIVIYKPRKAPEEIKAERDAAQARIRELEAELGIRGRS